MCSDARAPQHRSLPYLGRVAARLVVAAALARADRVAQPRLDGDHVARRARALAHEVSRRRATAGHFSAVKTDEIRMHPVAPARITPSTRAGRAGGEYIILHYICITLQNITLPYTRAGRAGSELHYIALYLHYRCIILYYITIILYYITFHASRASWRFASALSGVSSRARLRDRAQWCDTRGPVEGGVEPRD